MIQSLQWWWRHADWQEVLTYLVVGVVVVLVTVAIVLGHKDRTCLETETNVSYFDGDGNAQYETHCIVYAVKVDKKWTIEEVR